MYKLVLRIRITQITNHLMSKTSTFIYIKFLDSGNFQELN